MYNHGLTGLHKHILPSRTVACSIPSESASLFWPKSECSQKSTIGRTINRVAVSMLGQIQLQPEKHHSPCNTRDSSFALAQLRVHSQKCHRPPNTASGAFCFEPSLKSAIGLATQQVAVPTLCQNPPQSEKSQLLCQQATWLCSSCVGIELARFIVQHIWRWAKVRVHFS